MKGLIQILRNFTLIGILLQFITTAGGELALLIQEDVSSCLATEGSSALAWVLPTSPNSSPLGYKESTEWISPNNSSELQGLSCDLNNKITCEGWSGVTVTSNTQVEGSHLNFSPVLNYRWNNFQIYESDGSTNYSGKIPVTLKPSDTSIFHISVLTEDNAYIFLSAGDDPTEHQLYWIIIDGWKSESVKSVIRKCPTGAYRHRQPCDITRASKFTEVLHSGRQWVHVTIHLQHYTWYHTKKKEKVDGLNITLWSSDKNEKILHWNDRYYSFDINYIFFRTYNDKRGYWKFHEYRVLDANNSSSKVSSSEIQVSAPQSLCVSLFYFSSNETQLNVLRDGFVHHRESLKSGITWQNKRIESHLEPNHEYQLEIILEQESQFYIGDIRICQKKELFVSKLETIENLKCVELSSNISIDKSDNMKELPFQRFDCLGDNFGHNCSLSCSMVLGTECRGVTACVNNLCSCLAGYIFSDEKQLCTTECAPHTFGPNCKFSCGHCLNNSSCHPGTGVCMQGCEEHYRQPYCNTELPILTEISAADVEVNPDGFTINLDEMSIIKKATHILLQYKEKEEMAWQNDTNLYSWPVSVLYMKGLKSSTEYKFRAVLLDDQQGYFGDEIPVLNISTTCQIISESDVEISSNFDSIIIDWKVTKESCAPSDYKITVDERTASYNYLPILIPNLQSNYHGVTISYTGNNSIIFDEIVELEVTDSDWVFLTTVVLLTLLTTSFSISFLCWLKFNYFQNKIATDSNLKPQVYYKRNTMYDNIKNQLPTNLINMSFDFDNMYEDHVYEEPAEVSSYKNIGPCVIEDNKYEYVIHSSSDRIYENLDKVSDYDDVENIKENLDKAEYFNVLPNIVYI